MRDKIIPYIELAKRNHWAIATQVILVILFLALALISKSSVFALLFAILVFNHFDVLGYHYVLMREWAKEEYWVNLEEKIRSAYRVIQTTFEILLILFLWTNFGIISVIAFKIAHLSAVQDVLYYIVLRIKYPTYWTWLNWTFVGWFWKKEKILNKIPNKEYGREKYIANIPNKFVIIQAIIGFIISFVICLISDL